MAPKVRAATRFARFGGTAIVTSLALAAEALDGRAGTRVMSARSAVTYARAEAPATR
jgi:carbamate kinase